ncbi:unnamed protein product [Staurois parvus]|uniref:NADH dehydrogenase subunit 1 n=1 Tax=Staurois parvus TaxID=386267 RepID=A0ABN9ATY4_9NEOB|nr:unnamed protein product [Staurois parvus]
MARPAVSALVLFPMSPCTWYPVFLFLCLSSVADLCIVAVSCLTPGLPDHPSA